MNREAIYSALFALWTPVSGLVTLSRTLKHWTDVPASERPALFQTQGKQTVAATAANGLPNRWYLDAALYVYVSTEAGGPSPGEVLNPIMDAITSKLDPNPMGTPQMLAGLVEWARIEGTIETYEGTLGNDEVAIVPVRMLTV